MALSETRKLMEDSRSIIEGNGDDLSVPLLLNTFISLVSSIDKRLQVVEKGIENFGEFKNIITSLTSRVITNKQGLKTCQTKVTELETNVQGIGNLFDDVKARCDRNKIVTEENSKELEQAKACINKLFKNLSELSDQRQECNCQTGLENMKEKVLDLQCRSMKNNLVFTGLYNVRDENTEKLLRCFLNNELGIDYKIEFGNVHRFGRYQGGGRPIVARFLYHCDLQYVLDNAYRLRNTRYGIKQQFPKEIEDRRRKLYPIMKEAKRNRKIATLVRDRLFIDNELYQIPDDAEIADIPYQDGSLPTRQGGSSSLRQSDATPQRLSYASPQRQSDATPPRIERPKSTPSSDSNPKKRSRTGSTPKAHY
ncbi:unnamed protein product [Mytilus coruscus]|uniref:Uncharacterized protein n=1 Tax=Mytilus coruscus TaxID=42192 RepID=A0A6J8B9R1_MYTCO|nr:unnamed protein product [Mytilus coruscus]